MNKYNIIFNKISTVSEITSRDFFTELIKNEYIDINGWGFSCVNLINSSIVSAILLKKTIAYYKVWNEKTGDMERQSYNMIKEIRFYIDFKKSLLAVEGNVANMNYVKQIIRKLFWKTFIYDTLSITVSDFLFHFYNDKLLKNIEELTFTDFHYKNYFLGKYTARLITPLIDINMLADYKLSLVKIKAILTFEDDEIIFTATNHKNIIISCGENTLYNFFNYLTTKLY